MNPIVLVTGGSRGIGAATCKYLAKQNYAVCVNYISNKLEATKVVSDIEKEGGLPLLYKLMFQKNRMLFACLKQLINL